MTLTPEQRAQLDAAKKELSKLHLLGPAAWLCARDALRKYTFFADIDWRFLPPLVLDQCRLYSREGMPWAFVTWARVSDAVDARLRSGTPVIAPHEWQSGERLWLVDVVAPFGDAAGIARQALGEIGAERASAWLPGADGRAAVNEVRRDG